MRYNSVADSFKGVSIRLRSCVFAQLYALLLTNIYFDTFLKIYCPDSFQIFTVPGGHRRHQRVKILRESDEGIFRGKGGKNFFDPYISLKGGHGTPKFLHTLAPLRTLMKGT